MQPEVRTVLDAILAGRPVSPDGMRAAVGAIMEGRCGPPEIAALLTSLAVRGETADELAGAARALRERAAAIPTTRSGLLDTCGTGGDRLHTFNISTAAAIVAAGAGVPVAKHGNRGVSSSSGSCDVLEALGVRVELLPEAVGRCIDEIGIGFCFARIAHSAMRHVAPIRAELGFPTLFNLLGPLTNPAKAEFQLIGASRIARAEKLAQAVSRLGTMRTLVVCGADELDEVALWGETTVFDVRGDRIERMNWNAEALGLPGCRAEDLRVRSPAESAALITRILTGDEQGAPRDIVLANAAAALLAAGAATSLHEGVAQARESIESGAARRALEQLVQWTRKEASSSR